MLLSTGLLSLCNVAVAVQMQGRHAGLVLAPHLYPPSITWNPAELAAAAAERWDLSWGLKWEGQDVTPEVRQHALCSQGSGPSCNHSLLLPPLLLLLMLFLILA
jgi:hypothetical protein